jgi:hypothetical protein
MKGKTLSLLGCILFVAASSSLAQVAPPDIEKPLDPPPFEVPLDGKPDGVPVVPNITIPERPTVVVPDGDDTETPELPERPEVPLTPTAMLEQLMDIVKQLQAIKETAKTERQAIRDTVKETLKAWVEEQRAQAKETAEAAKAMKDNLPSVSDIVESAKNEGRGR